MAYVQPYPLQQELYGHIRMKVGIMPEITSKLLISQEKPTGTINGVNKQFALSKTPIALTETVIRNGLIMLRGANFDYTISGKTISFIEAPPANASLAVNYETYEG